MRIAIVGATGVYGKAVIPLLVQQGHSVRALVRSPDKAHAMFDANVEVIHFELLAPDAAQMLRTLLAGCDAVMHLATAIPRDASAPDAWENNTRLRTEGTRALLDASLMFGIKHYIQQSIVMAYAKSHQPIVSKDCEEEDFKCTAPRPLRVLQNGLRAQPGIRSHSFSQSS